MKTIYRHIIILVLCVVPAVALQAADVKNSTSTVVSAQVMATSTADRIKAFQDEMRTRVENRKSELRKNLAQKNGVAKKLDTQAATRVRTNLVAIYGKLSQKINRLSRIDSEITRKISAVAVISSSTASSSAFVASLNESQKKAKALLSQARIDLESTRVVALSEIATSTTKETIRSLVSTAETSIKVAAEAYRKILTTIKPLGTPVTKK